MNYDRMYNDISHSLSIYKNYMQTPDSFMDMVIKDYDISVLDLIHLLPRFVTKQDRLSVCIMSLLVNPTLKEIMTFTITDLDNELLKQEPFYVHYKMYYVSCYLKILEGEGEL